MSACIVVALIDKNDYSKDDHIVDEIPSPNDILYGLEKYGETEFSIESVINYYLNNGNYSRHTVKDEYCMVYQITSEEEARDVEKILGIKENLPAIDYSKKYMLLSTGRELTEINIKREAYDENNNQIMTFEYAEGDYKEKTAYILICTPKVRHFWRCIFFMGKTGRKNKNYSPEFKIGVIMDMREHRLGYCETVRKYGLGAVETGGARAMLQRWERIFLEEGAEGLMKERRGKSNTSCKRGRPPKLDKKVEEDLIAENQRLRMEIEYLKKLSALVLADEQKNGKRRS